MPIKYVYITQPGGGILQHNTKVESFLLSWVVFLCYGEEPVKES